MTRRIRRRRQQPQPEPELNSSSREESRELSDEEWDELRTNLRPRPTPGDLRVDDTNHNTSVRIGNSWGNIERVLIEDVLSDVLPQNGGDIILSSGVSGDVVFARPGSPDITLTELLARFDQVENMLQETRDLYDRMMGYETKAKTQTETEDGPPKAG